MASHQFICFLAMISLMIINISANMACHPDDLKGLNDFKAGIHSDTSGRLSKWIGQDCCNWPGISCNSTTNRVVEIYLPGHYVSGEDESPNFVSSTMSGSISLSISLLTSLQVIDFNKLVGLTGQIPESIGVLKNLRELNLQTNQISSTIPESVFTLTSLTTLNLENNHLTGEISENIGNLQALQKLFLSNNSFTGKIPVSITKLHSISTIHLEINQLVVIPDSIGYLTSLSSLSISNNQLTGPIPSCLGNIKQLQILKVNNNNFSVEMLPTSICGLTELSVLFVSQNKIHGPLPGCLSSFKYLLDVDIPFKRTVTLPMGVHK
ncbi:hypothetical protein H5410_001432 [Solanum commersonii]|uniref:Leucine-rich repeat-containing N-terminal plant-type domain-containing protein n=1 Tax=Solanum commersonii TaxID=4109 RepID=A0A9J6AZN3_SOLCO|nr:hypothetical protein H5410_001432 [Solanum commersonii]